MPPGEGPGRAGSEFLVIRRASLCHRAFWVVSTAHRTASSAKATDWPGARQDSRCLTCWQEGRSGLGDPFALRVPGRSMSRAGLTVAVPITTDESLYRHARVPTTSVARVRWVGSLGQSGGRIRTQPPMPERPQNAEAASSGQPARNAYRRSSSFPSWSPGFAMRCGGRFACSIEGLLGLCRTRVREPPSRHTALQATAQLPQRTLLDLPHVLNGDPQRTAEPAVGPLPRTASRHRGRSREGGR